MTIICACLSQRPRGVLMGWDDRSLIGTTIVPGTIKVTAGPHWIGGIAGVGRLCEVYTEVIAECRDPRPTAFRDMLRTRLRDLDFARYDRPGQGDQYDLMGLLSDGNQLWLIPCDFTLLQIRGYYAVGSGSDYALGAMHAVNNEVFADDEGSPRIVRSGLAAAMAFDANVAGASTTLKFWSPPEHRADFG